MTLADFLLARIAEDEKWATMWVREYSGSHPTAMSGEQVLAECEAKRRIIEDVGSGINDGGAEGWAADIVLSALAAVYSDHPDCDPAWRA